MRAEDTVRRAPAGTDRAHPAPGPEAAERPETGEAAGTSAGGSPAPGTARASERSEAGACGPGESASGECGSAADPRRRVLRTDAVLADPRLAEALRRLGPGVVKPLVAAAQQRVRDGELAADAVVTAVLRGLPPSAGGLRPVLNATGVLLHTNLGRAPLSAAARAAVADACGCTDVELDLGTGRRARRGAAALAALRDAVPAAEAAHVVNNGAAALILAVTALAAGREVVVGRGELVEIGDGFRLPDLLVSTGARLREVGTTNRTTPDDYQAAIGPDTGCVLKVHPANFRITGFTRAATVAELSRLPVPVIADIGSGLLAPDPALPAEPDAQRTLRAGAALVTASGDKLLGGPQCGLVLGRAEPVRRLARHPLARALRVDKLTLAALTATLRGPHTPTHRALHTDVRDLRARAAELARRLRADGLDARAVDTEAAVGGGGAPGVVLPSAALSVPERFAAPLRTGTPAVLGRVAGGRCLLDLRAVPGECDPELAGAVRAAAGR
ncbi:L-seryl-tRNA(Sec) selenium transferase [Streptomyces sp. RS10V-4]|uniref:L-seryl-tRNA(Sec) selenium transferase n=1 Tax=Streptomyces rhizoryzae TaxID=2932493 RepID=UPI002006B03F|nr:L-seryl-tRNA(Sec) selenium transferase [Streptomyces rhizoryzae]MCK7622484.1 L-seryl-tRNA(Sec) selenium transferase [Streptomyces rhizoryzae]